MKKPLVSLCIPTNGIAKWVFPVLQSIYSQNVSNELFQVVVTDNGKDTEFQKKMKEYAKEHSNLIYKITDALMFQNQIEALRLANGEFLKFVNHRSVFLPGSLKWMIELIEQTKQEKPVIYLSCGALGNKSRKTLKSFDSFVFELKEYASWTTGVGVWQSDFLEIPQNHVYNDISPHSDILFFHRNKKTYMIDDYVWAKEIDASHSKKGTYDLYRAFAVQELSLTLSLLVAGDITAKTFRAVKKAYFFLVARFYLQFSILHDPCSYRLDGFRDAMGVFFCANGIRLCAYLLLAKMLLLYVPKKISCAFQRLFQMTKKHRQRQNKDKTKTIDKFC